MPYGLRDEGASFGPTGAQAFDDAHNGDPCSAGSFCGARRTPWPGAVVVDPGSDRALIFYSREYTEPTSSYAFRSEGGSVATWAAPDHPATRPEVRTDGPDKTLLWPGTFLDGTIHLIEVTLR